MPKLTDAFVAAARPDGRDRLLADSQITGFALRLTPTGAKIFVARTSIAGQRRRRQVTLGTFPALSTARARDLALQALADMRRGADPTAARKALIETSAAARRTLAELAAKWMAEHVAKKKPRTQRDYMELLAKHILPALGHLPVAVIERDDVVRLHVDMARTPRRANYVISTVRAIFNFAIDAGWRPVGSNPARRITMYPEHQRERFLSEHELVRAADGIALAERAGRIGVHAAAGLRFALMTGTRSGEVTAIQWEHIKWSRKLVRLPDSNEPGRKSGARTIYLSDAVVELLRSIPHVEPYVIAGAKPGEPYKNLGRAWMVARALVGLKDVRLHDLRHSYASFAAGKGLSLPMIGKLLGHKVPATTARYAHLAKDVVSDVSDQLGAAMTAVIESAPPQPAAVIKLARRRSRRG
jgi:integrase